MLEAGVRQTVGEIAVVGHDEQALAVLVEPSDRNQPLGRPYEVGYGLAPERVAHGAEDADRLVQRHGPAAFFGPDQPSMHSYLCVRGEPRPRLPDHDTVDSDRSGRDKLRSAAPGCKARPRKNVLKPLCHASTPLDLTRERNLA